MASDDLVEVEGVVTKEGGGGKFIVQLENGMDVIAHLCGKMREHRIRVVMGDRVKVAVSPYDLSRGRITFRHKT